MDKATRKAIEDIHQMHERILQRQRDEDAEFKQSLQHLDFDELVEMEDQFQIDVKQLYGYHGPGHFVAEKVARLQMIQDEMCYLDPHHAEMLVPARQIYKS